MKPFPTNYNIHYPKLFGGALMLFLMALSLIIRSDKPRAAFIHQKGTISYLSSIHPLKGGSDERPKDVYLILYESDRIFELFIGTDKGDFSPRLNRLDELNVGDEIDIYFEETYKTKVQQVNQLLQYLDKEGELYYLRSRADQYIGYFTLAASGLVLLLRFYLKFKKT